jgi:hypothetical protein
VRRGLGRLVEHDERSRYYPWAEAHLPIASVQWPRLSPILDQGELGSCTGNAMAGWLGTAPYAKDPSGSVRFNEALAVELYSLATKLDGFPGQYPPEDTGSSGLAVAKAARKLGFIKTFTWCYSTDALMRRLQHGPVIVGTVWLAGMMAVDSAGFVDVSGEEVGGHEYLIRGLHVDGDRSHFVCDNSWSTGWGIPTESSPHGGSFRLRVADWVTLRARQADVTVPHA